MIQKYNRTSFFWGVPGIILQIGGLSRYMDPGWGVIGTILLLVGLSYYARAKGRNWAWCLFAFVPFLGIIVLFCLQDKSQVDLDQVASTRRTYRVLLIVFSITLGPLAILMVIMILTQLFSHPSRGGPLILAPLFLLLLISIPFLLVLRGIRNAKISIRADHECDETESDSELMGHEERTSVEDNSRNGDSD